jgi:hypothetical protein
MSVAGLQLISLTYRQVVGVMRHRFLKLGNAKTVTGPERIASIQKILNHGVSNNGSALKPLDFPSSNTKRPTSEGGSQQRSIDLITLAERRIAHG